MPGKASDLRRVHHGGLAAARAHGRGRFDATNDVDDDATNTDLDTVYTPASSCLDLDLSYHVGLASPPHSGTHAAASGTAAGLPPRQQQWGAPAAPSAAAPGRGIAQGGPARRSAVTLRRSSSMWVDSTRPRRKPSLDDETAVLSGDDDDMPLHSALDDCFDDVIDRVIAATPRNDMLMRLGITSTASPCNSVRDFINTTPVVDTMPAPASFLTLGPATAHAVSSSVVVPASVVASTRPRVAPGDGDESAVSPSSARAPVPSVQQQQQQQSTPSRRAADTASSDGAGDGHAFVAGGAFGSAPTPRSVGTRGASKRSQRLQRRPNQAPTAATDCATAVPDADEDHKADGPDDPEENTAPSPEPAAVLDNAVLLDMAPVKDLGALDSVLDSLLCEDVKFDASFPFMFVEDGDHELSFEL